MKRLELVTNLVIGGVGAGGQAFLLAHSLDAYPFQILISPPAEFYSATGAAVGLVSPILSLLALYLFRSTWRPFITAIPVVACPLLFWLLFRLVFAVSGYHYADPSTRSDLVATRAIENGFAGEVVSLTFSGLVVGILCGSVVWFIFKYARQPKVG